MQPQVTKVTLNNGLLVLLKEIHSAPLISHWMWYRVGSRDESAGMTGSSHWVEHMQFKGTPQFPSKVLDRSISRLGGVWNALTHLDWTTYFETLPADKIDLALRLEADRMSNSLFETGEVATERNVIISERQGHENEPVFKLTEEVQAAAFRVHPYHHMVIGDLADLETMQRDDLYRHYRAYYVPNNAVLTIAGHFKTERMLADVRRSFESIPPGAEPARRNRTEPAKSGEKQVTVEGPGETIYLQFTYQVPAVKHPDFLAIMVLDSLLTGPSNLNLFGAGISNKTSLLYQALVEKELAVTVFGGLQATIDPFLYTITTIVHPKSNPEKVRNAVDEQIKLLQDQPPSAASLERAVKQARALFAYGSESITNQAFWLGISEMVADYHWYLDFLEKLSAITPLDLQRVAQVYLRPQNRVLGQYIPSENENKHPST